MQLNELIQKVVDAKRQDHALNELLASRLMETGGVVYGGAVWTGKIEGGHVHLTESVEPFEKPGEPEGGWATTELIGGSDRELSREFGFALASEIAV